MQKKGDLEEMNTALKVFLKQRNEDKAEFEEKILTNLQQLVEPYNKSLKQTRLSDRQQNVLGLIENNLSELVSAFAKNYAFPKYKLTHKEIQVADLIKKGKTSKEISEILCLTTRTIEYHRIEIRKKFGLKGGKANLRAFLLSLQ